MRSKTYSCPTTIVNRRRIVGTGSLTAAMLLTGRVPAFAQIQPKKLDFANILGGPDVGGIAMEFFAKEVTARAKGEVEVVFHGGTLLNKELEIMNAVKSGNVAIGSPAGAAATVYGCSAGALPRQGLRAGLRPHERQDW
jgi:TRAP-type transport system periplasmic protein